MIYVVRGLQTPLVGCPAIQSLNLVTRIVGITRNKAFITAEYPQLFNGLGKIKGPFTLALFLMCFNALR